MSEQTVSLAVASAVRICFDRLGGGGWQGRFYTRCSASPTEFDNIGEMLEGMEAFYNWLDYPQVSTLSRDFREGSQERAIQQRAQRRKNRKGEQAVVMSADDMEKKHGQQATFMVRIQYRQNATWQGQVTWAEKKKTLPFRSALELIKLIDSTQEEHEAGWGDA